MAGGGGRPCELRAVCVLLCLPRRHRVSMIARAAVVGSIDPDTPNALATIRSSTVIVVRVFCRGGALDLSGSRYAPGGRSGRRPSPSWRPSPRRGSSGRPRSGGTRPRGAPAAVAVPRGAAAAGCTKLSRIILIRSLGVVNPIPPFISTFVRRYLSGMLLQIIGGAINYG